MVVCTLSVIIEEKSDFPPLQTNIFCPERIFPVHATSASCSIYLQILHIAMLTDTFLY
jgi:hypothetical protein